MRMLSTIPLLASLMLVVSCRDFKAENREPPADAGAAAPSFNDDLAFLKRNTDILLLEHGDAAVAVAPAYQGRVMTSTYDLRGGPSFGWINREVVEQGFLAPAKREGKLQDHIYVFGGEERFWMGPEGGQFSIFFKPDDPFDFEHWHTPPCLDTDRYKVVRRDKREIVFRHECRLKNWSGNILKVGMDRTIRILDSQAVAERLGVEIGDVSLVAYETENTISNLGEEAWTKKSGMPSIWLLGMYPPSPGTTIVIPFKQGSEKELGPKVNDAYFGKVPADYLQVGDGVVFMKGDGTHRSKIGISPARSKGVAGSYDEDTGVLNIVTYFEPGENPGYVNSMWEMQKKPFAGDVLNAYNDGPPTPGADPLGPFYELETSSPAADLEAGESLTHVQTTVHLKGPRKSVDRIARQVLGSDISHIEKAF